MKNPRIKKILAAAMAVILFTMCFSACKGRDEAGEIVLNIYVDPHTQASFTFDPGIDYQGANSLNIGVCETLFELNEDASGVIGVLATEQKMTSPTQWEITIRDDVLFSNGKPLTAQKVKDALEYELENLPRLQALLKVDSIEADGQLLRINTTSFVAILPKFLTDTSLIIFDTDEMDDLNHNIIGTGAFIIESCDDEGNSSSIRNADYWRGPAVADRVNCKVGLTDEAITLALQSGELDWGTVQPTDITLFGDGYDLYQSDSNGRVYYLYFNQGYTFTADEALREALFYAFDRDAIITGLYAGSCSAAYTIFPEYSSIYTGDVQPAFNAETAKKILSDGGYKDTDGDGFVEKDGVKVLLKIVVYDANQFPKLAEALQDQLKKIGIDSDIKIAEAIMDELGTGNFNIATYGYNTLSFGDSYNYLQPVFSDNGTSNFVHFHSDAVEDALNLMASEADPEQRSSLARKICDEIYAQKMHMYLVRVIKTTVVRSEITATEEIFGTRKNIGLHLYAIGKEK
mgnify:CR=1 FL=1